MRDRSIIDRDGMCRRRSSRTAGFTLAELLVVAAIIALLMAIILPQFAPLRSTAQATRVVQDLQAIEGQFQLLLAESNLSSFPHESVYRTIPGGEEYPELCAANPPLSETDLYSNVDDRLDPYRGPYFERTTETPYGNEYAYDNDGDAYSDSPVWNGTNITIQWCSDALDRTDMLEEIDRIIDSGDGSDAGVFRWGGSTALYLLDDNE